MITLKRGGTCSGPRARKPDRLPRERFYRNFGIPLANSSSEYLAAIALHPHGRIGAA